MAGFGRKPSTALQHSLTLLESTESASVDPIRTFAQKCPNVCFGGFTEPTKTPVMAPMLELPIES